MKQHVVHMTKDYDKFQVYSFNRPINEGLVKRLMESIQKIGYMEGKEVLVDANLAIIDGQHRFNACVGLGIEVPYTVTDVDPHDAIIHLNANQDHWKIKDYVHTWAQSGLECYQQLEEFEAKYKLGAVNSMNLLFAAHGMDKTDTKRVKSGHEFKLNPKASEMAEFILSCELIPYNKSSNFIRAIVKLFKLANKTQIEKVQKHLTSLPQQPSAGAYLISFENIINRGVQTANRISFKLT